MSQPEASMNQPEASGSPAQASMSQPEASGSPSDALMSQPEVSGSPSEASGSPSEASGSPTEASGSPTEASKTSYFIEYFCIYVQIVQVVMKALATTRDPTGCPYYTLWHERPSPVWPRCRAPRSSEARSVSGVLFSAHVHG